MASHGTKLTQKSKALFTCVLERKDNAYTINVPPTPILTHYRHSNSFMNCHYPLPARGNKKWPIPRIHLQTTREWEIRNIPLQAERSPQMSRRSPRLGTAEDDLIKDLFIAFMNSTEIQSELLTETRTPAQVLQYALNKERGQENQRAIAGRLRATNIMDNQIAHIGPNQYPQQRRTQPQDIRKTTNQQRRLQQQKNQGQSNPCRRCGAPFSLEHLQICPAKKAHCNNFKQWLSLPCH